MRAASDEDRNEFTETKPGWRCFLCVRNPTARSPYRAERPGFTGRTLVAR